MTFVEDMTEDYDFRQLEALARAEGAAARLEPILVDWQRRLQATLFHTTFNEDLFRIRQAIFGVIRPLQESIHVSLRLIFDWSFLTTGAIYFRNVPPEFIVGQSTQPVEEARRTKLPDQVEQLVLNGVFEMPSEQRIEQFLRQSIWGDDLSWEQRIAGMGRHAQFDKIARELTAGLSAGEDIEQLTNRIEDLVGNVRFRAKRIARTEALRVSNLAQFEAWRHVEDRIAGYQINEILDERTRPHHAARHGTIFWTDRRRRPNIRDMPLLPDEPNCRGWYTLVMKNAAGEVFRPPNAPSARDMTKWWDRQSIKNRRSYVGAKRWDVLRKRLGRRKLQWYDFVDDEGKLLSVNQLRFTNYDDLEARRDRVERSAIARRELLSI